ncbi:hypothetical protein [Rhodopseudomonas palustris]|nr:hypothetical protein [Rhodopseudomonas palustris]
MSADDAIHDLLHALKKGDHLVEALLHGGRRGSPFEALRAAGLIDRTSLADRRFWTGVAIGSAAMLALSAVAGARREPPVPEAVAEIEDPA